MQLPHLALLAPLFGVALLAQTPSRDASNSIRLRYATFDPLVEQPAVPAAMASTNRHSLWIVQFSGTPTAAGRDAIAAIGGKVIGYLPDNAYVVRMPMAQAERTRAIATIRWVGPYHPAYRLEQELLAVHGNGAATTTPLRCNLVVADKHTDKQVLIARLRALGAQIDDEHAGSLLLEATLTGAQLQLAAGLDEVLWIDRSTAIELDTDNARIQGGANYIEVQGGYTGARVNAHVYEGLEASHPDFPGTVTNVSSGGAPTAHGHATAGILFGNGASNPIVRGMAPDCGKFYTDFSTATASRWQVFSNLVNTLDVSHTTASWGNTPTIHYTSISAESDDIVFDHDLAWTQSFGNGPGGTRPQAWAKNVFSVGGVWHGNDSNPANDSWLLGGASSGPAIDGRIKPTLVGYVDSVGTSDLTGTPGYTPLNWNANFGGTSASTPMVGGHNVLAIEMFTDEVTPGFGLFGNALRVPGGTAHQNRPHFPTLKALMVVSAAQYAFTGLSSDNRREHQGWGFPDLRQLYGLRSRTFVVDETDVLTQGQTRTWDIDVAIGEPALKVCLSWNEPPGNPAAASTLVNNLSLRVTAPGGAQVYWGNHGLRNGVWSTAGGSEDVIDSIECVFVQNPLPGTWRIQVLASSVVQDNHVETTALDADYGLVVTGGAAALAAVTTVGTGCAGVALTAAPRPLLGTTISLATTGAPAGTLLGLSILSLHALNPALALASLGMPGCELHQPLDLLVAFATSAGSGSLPLLVPNDPSLAGTVIYNQAATLTPGLNAFGFATSNGLALTIGVY